MDNLKHINPEQVIRKTQELYEFLNLGEGPENNLKYLDIIDKNKPSETLRKIFTTANEYFTDEGDIKEKSPSDLLKLEIIKFANYFSVNHFIQIDL